MKKIKLTQNKLTEIISKVISEQEDGGVTDIQDDLLNIPLELRKQLKVELQQMLGDPADVDNLEAIDFYG